MNVEQIIIRNMRFILSIHNLSSSQISTIDPYRLANILDHRIKPGLDDAQSFCDYFKYPVSILTTEFNAFSLGELDGMRNFFSTVSRRKRMMQMLRHAEQIMDIYPDIEPIDDFKRDFIEAQGKTNNPVFLAEATIDIDFNIASHANYHRIKDVNAWQKSILSDSHGFPIERIFPDKMMEFITCCLHSASSDVVTVDCFKDWQSDEKSNEYHMKFRFFPSICTIYILITMIDQSLPAGIIPISKKVATDRERLDELFYDLQNDPEIREIILDHHWGIKQLRKCVDKLQS